MENDPVAATKSSPDDAQLTSVLQYALNLTRPDETTPHFIAEPSPFALDGHTSQPSHTVLHPTPIRPSAFTRTSDTNHKSYPQLFPLRPLSATSPQINTVQLGDMEDQRTYESEDATAASHAFKSVRNRPWSANFTGPSGYEGIADLVRGHSVQMIRMRARTLTDMSSTTVPDTLNVPQLHTPEVRYAVYICIWLFSQHRVHDLQRARSASSFSSLHPTVRLFKMPSERSDQSNRQVSIHSLPIFREIRSIG